MNPSQTTNPIHFSDLNPKRFEDMCHQLIYKEFENKENLQLNHDGRNGNDGGIDIFGKFNENEAIKTLVVQCRRQEKTSFKELRF